MLHKSCILISLTSTHIARFAKSNNLQNLYLANLSQSKNSGREVHISMLFFIL